MQLTKTQRAIHSVSQAILASLTIIVLIRWYLSSDKGAFSLITPLYILVPLLALSVFFSRGKNVEKKLPGILGTTYGFLFIIVPMVWGIFVLGYRISILILGE